MAGVTIRVEFDDREVRRALDRLAKAGADLTPAMREIGETLLNSARERFSAQTSPDGTLVGAVKRAHQEAEEASA